MNSAKHSELVNHIWSVADRLRGDYKASEYGQVIQPFTVLRRLECVLAPTKDKVLEEAKQLDAERITDPKARGRFLRRAAGGRSFYNESRYTLKKIAADADHAAEHLRAYVDKFSENAKEIFTAYRFDEQIKRLKRADLLYQVVGQFADIDLSLYELDEDGQPVLDDDGEKIEVVSNHQMGYIFEELIRKFAEQSNETAGEHFTPREVIELMTRLLIGTDSDNLVMPGRAIRILDPACGTGGMLTASKDLIEKLNPEADVEVFGQELNAESWAICRSDLLIKGEDAGNIVRGNSFTEDGHEGEKFDYLLANPPFGVEWKKVQKFILDEAEKGSGEDRFSAGYPVDLKGDRLPTTPRINDGSLLFLQHMIAKMRPVETKAGTGGEPDRVTGGGRVAIVFNGSPLFTGAAASGESNIRRWIIESDMLEAVVALPDQLFYNTGISTYFWIVTNRKDPDHRGKVVLLDARDHFVKRRKSLGDKRKDIGDGRNGRPDQIGEIEAIYRDAIDIAKDAEHPHHKRLKVFANEEFGYRRITVERPLKLRFAITDDTLAELRAAKPLQKLTNLNAIVDALKPLVGQQWERKVEAYAAMRDAVAADGVIWPKMTATVSKAIRGIVGIRDRDGEEQTDKDGNPEPDPELRDYENIALHEDPDKYLEREVLPFAPDAWIDHDKTKIGYEIPFTRHFYEYKPPRPLAEIDAELKELEAEIQQLLGEVSE